MAWMLSACMAVVKMILAALAPPTERGAASRPYVRLSRWFATACFSKDHSLVHMCYTALIPHVSTEKITGSERAVPPATTVHPKSLPQSWPALLLPGVNPAQRAQLAALDATAWRWLIEQAQRHAVASAALTRFVSSRVIVENQQLSAGWRRLLYLLCVTDHTRDSLHLIRRTVWPDGAWLAARYGRSDWGMRLRHATNSTAGKI